VCGTSSRVQRGEGANFVRGATGDTFVPSDCAKKSFAPNLVFSSLSTLLVSNTTTVDALRWTRGNKCASFKTSKRLREYNPTTATMGPTWVHLSRELRQGWSEPARRPPRWYS
jgi:hypothetical protein